MCVCFAVEKGLSYHSGMLQKDADIAHVEQWYIITGIDTPMLPIDLEAVCRVPVEMQHLTTKQAPQAEPAAMT